MAATCRSWLLPLDRLAARSLISSLSASVRAGSFSTEEEASRWLPSTEEPREELDRVLAGLSGTNTGPKVLAGLSGTELDPFEKLDAGEGKLMNGMGPSAELSRDRKEDLRRRMEFSATIEFSRSLSGKWDSDEDLSINIESIDSEGLRDPMFPAP